MARTKKTAEEPKIDVSDTPIPEVDEAELMKDVNVPFVTQDNPGFPNIVLPASAFFDQELGEVIFNKLMKAPVKDYQVLLWLSKLGATINNISKELVTIRNRLAAIAGFTETDFTSLTPETLNGEEYQRKSFVFGTLLNKYIFDKTISLAPLGSLHLDLTNPDGHAKAFLEGASLSADDLDKLNTFEILKITLPAEEEKPSEEEKSQPQPQSVEDTLPTNDAE